MANGFFTDRAVATSPFRLGGSGFLSVSGLIAIPYGQVRVCTSADIGTSTTPCPHLASVFDSNGNPLSVPAGGFGQATTDVAGRFSFQATPANYLIQVAPSGSNTPEVSYPVTVSNFTLGATPTLIGNNTFTGLNIFTNSVYACRFEGGRYVDFANNCGWAGATVTDWINSAYADCPSMGCNIYVEAGTYGNPTPLTTGIVFNTANKPATLYCPPNTSFTFGINSGAAMTIDTGINHKAASGMVGCTFLNIPSALTTAVGINFPNTNGAENVKLQNIKVGSGDSTPWLVTTAASVTSNVATITLASNPITAGFTSPSVIRVGGFTGADTYFNGTFTLTSVTATQATFALIHANASATTNGVVMQPSFVTGINVAGGQLVIFDTIDQSNIFGNITGISNVQAGGQSSENFRVINSVIARNDIGISIGGAVDFQSFGNSIDDNITAGISCTTGQLNIHSTHFENAGLGPSNYINTACLTNIFGGEMLDDDSNAAHTQPQFVVANGSPSSLIMEGVFAQTAGRVITQVAALSNTVYATFNFFRSGANLGADYSTSSFGGKILDLNGQTSGIQIDSSGNIIGLSKICAGGSCGSAANGDLVAARANNVGNIALGNGVGAGALFYSGGTTIVIQSGGNQTFPTGAGTVANAITATSAAFATATVAGTCVQNTTAVIGATTAMSVSVSPVSTPGVGAVWSAFVSSAGNVTINECAVAASAGGTIAFNIRVIQ